MSKIRLGVNIDHVATIRNARGERYPDPLRAAKAAIDYGADPVTVHLREDRRHINDNDLKNIIKLKKNTCKFRNCTNHGNDKDCFAKSTRFYMYSSRKEGRNNN